MTTQNIIDAWDSGVEPYNATDCRKFNPFTFLLWEPGYGKTLDEMLCRDCGKNKHEHERALTLSYSLSKSDFPTA